MSPQSWINTALRSVIWLGAAAGWAYLQKPDGATVVTVRTDAIGWLGGGIVLAGLVLHFWGSAALARGERRGASRPVTDGPFRYIRHPIYLAGIVLLLGVGLLCAPLRAVDVGVPLLLLAYFHVAVVRVEEPELRRRFGSTYEEYCERVPRWLPVPTSGARAAEQRDSATDAARRR
ncbi:MAG: isoprenylcysteine carboxylmethyltransferase family protein [Acidobacteria bacterium]|nr:isoprenylcysteine carboxylmethyltransferase family protein [Acidobacteriota bacterium]